MGCWVSWEVHFAGRGQLTGEMVMQISMQPKISVIKGNTIPIDDEAIERELVSRIVEGETKVQSGKTGIQGLDSICTDLRQLKRSDAFLEFLYCTIFGKRSSA